MSVKDNHPACQSPICGCMDVCAVMDAADAARLEEREACAKLAETVDGDFERDTPGRTESAVRSGVAAAIRARNK